MGRGLAAPLQLRTPLPLSPFGLDFWPFGLPPMKNPEHALDKSTAHHNYWDGTEGGTATGN